MSTRITTAMITRSTLADINGVAARLSETQRRLSSGKEITRPSDDPFGTARALSLQSELESMRQFQRNTSDGNGWLTVTDTALGKIGDAAGRARELVLRGANDSLGPTARVALAEEIDQLIDTVKQEANATYGGRYVFAGTATNVRPYAPGATDTFAGNADTVAREIGPGVAVTVNVTGGALLGGDLPDPNDGKLLDTLRDIATHLRGGSATDLDALRTSDFVALDTNLDSVNRLRAGVGAAVNRLETAQGRLSELEEAATGLLSETVDADMAKVLVEYSTQQSVYQASLKAGASIVQSSLLDFLR